MSEKIPQEKQNKPEITLENIAVDTERLRFIEQKILSEITSAKRKVIEEITKEIGVGADSKSIPMAINEQQTRLDDAKLEMLGRLQKELFSDGRLTEYATEINAIIEGIRFVFLQQKILHYKDNLLLDNAPAVSSEEVKRQKILRNDQTEGRAIVQYHILQNEDDPIYLEQFVKTLNAITSQLGFKQEQSSYMRGITQELGIYRLLKKYFPRAYPATPEEDARYAIDFWVETKTGKRLIIQAKSSSIFGKEGIFDANDIKNLKERLERDRGLDKDQGISWEDRETLSTIVQARKLVMDVDTAHKYAEKLGYSDSEFILLISRSSNFKYPSGKPKEELTGKLERTLETLAAT